MLRFDWDSLRTGDRVVLHDDPFGSDLRLVEGTVIMVERRSGRRSANGVGIRIPLADGRRGIVWPSRLAVHADPPDPAESCWRCASLAPAERSVHRAPGDAPAATGCTGELVTVARSPTEAAVPAGADPASGTPR